MAFELIAEGTRDVTAVAVQAAATYTAVAVPINVVGVRAQRMSCAFTWSGVVGGDSGSIITLAAYGTWTAAADPTSAYYRCLQGIGSGATTAQTLAVTISNGAAGAIPFYVQGNYGDKAIMEPAAPFIWISFTKSGTGTLTAGTIGIAYRLFGDTR